MTAPLCVDVVGWLIGRLAAALPGVRVAGERPSDLSGPFVQVTRVGGPDDNLILDEPTVVFDCWDATAQTANQLGYQVAAAVRALRGQAAAGAVVTATRMLSGPRRVETVNPDLRHVALIMQPSIKTTFN